MIACETEVRSRGLGVSSMIRYITQGDKTEALRFVTQETLNIGGGGQKLPKLALHNFWTDPYSLHLQYSSSVRMKVLCKKETILLVQEQSVFV